MHWILKNFLIYQITNNSNNSKIFGPSPVEMFSNIIILIIIITNPIFFWDNKFILKLKYIKRAAALNFIIYNTYFLTLVLSLLLFLSTLLLFTSGFSFLSFLFLSAIFRGIVIILLEKKIFSPWWWKTRVLTKKGDARKSLQCSEVWNEMLENNLL